MLSDLIPPAWRIHLNRFDSNLRSIENALERLESGGKVTLPRREEIFAALDLAPEDVRVVILGQDPYPDPRFAIGRAFAVSDLVRPLPASLRNIFKERRDDCGGEDPSPTLLSWQQQGVLLLNRSLTTTSGEANSHSHLGWEAVTSTIVGVAAARGAVGLLWGKAAQSVEPLFSGRAVTGAHPSPLSAHRGFFGSRPFSKVNALLGEKIDW